MTPKYIGLGLFVVAVILILVWYAQKRSRWTPEIPSERIFPFRRNNLTGPAEDADDGWLKLRNLSGQAVMLHVSFRVIGATTAEILGAAYPLKDGSTGTLTQALLETLTYFHEYYPEELSGRDITDGHEARAEETVEERLVQIFDACPTLRESESFILDCHVSFQHVVDHERECAQSQPLAQ